MITLKGKYNSANIMIDSIDEETTKQIYSFLNHPAFAHTYIAIMPDTHAGAGSVIGYTAKMNDYIIPNIVGVDIGCGVLTIPLPGITKINYSDLDKFIKGRIPSGFNIRSTSDKLHKGKTIEQSLFGMDKYIALICEKMGQDLSRALGSVGTLGGGNHYIEIDIDPTGMFWLTIHSGSRNFGLKIANYHQNKAKEFLKKVFIGSNAFQGLEYLLRDSEEGNDYIKDMTIAQTYASINRRVMGKIIAYEFFGKEVLNDSFDTIHNYINMGDFIIRKGAVSAHEDEQLIIPFNMRDGAAICRGKGNAKWNYSAPHGAGRILSRRKAKETLSLDEFQKSMEGVYTTTATQNTIDESPMAYKEKQTIVEAIGETVDIEMFIKPVYNFKAGGE